jgi:hypothetical protein
VFIVYKNKRPISMLFQYKKKKKKKKRKMLSLSLQKYFSNIKNCKCVENA